MNEKKLEKMINWYVDECDENLKVDHLKGIEDKIKYFGKLTPEKINNFTAQEMEKLFDNIWSKIDFQSAKIVKDNGLDILKKELVNLLFGNDQIKVRWERFLTKISIFRSKGMTEILCSVYPQKFCIFNNVATDVFKYLEIEEGNLKNQVVFHYDEYEKILGKTEIIRKKLEEKMGVEQDFLDVDCMTYMFTTYTDEIKKMVKLSKKSGVKKNSMGYTIDSLAGDKVFLHKNACQKIIDLIEEKQNVILEGAPGVGKTFIAKRLCYAMMNEKNDDRILNIQFHQSYSYEDFVLGYRPNESGSFELKPGVFLDFCKKVNEDKENSYFVIIDEINRGNISKIFGELLVLIEKDKRETHSVNLAYQAEKNQYENFTIPKNLYILGLMNTADRSLALLDFALRRRFAFYRINPLFDEKGFKDYLNELNSPSLNKVVEKIRTLNEEVIKKDDSLGEGFMIGHSYFSNFNSKMSKKEIKTKIEDILEYEIIPILKEYWYDDKSKLEKYCNLKAWLND